uniref:Hypothetical pentapeptide repeat protein n=1 Tax=Spiroplasma citri TaxID=2133 RepID=Q14LI4_SPICI|nr:hypothetical pentapeptide repeat protein [Spiroplasma citri]
MDMKFKTTKEYKMKTLHEMIKDLTGITVEFWKINEYLASEALYLFCTNLESANLKGAGLQDADLKYANLYRANLKGADLSGAVLKDIKITKKQLEQLTVIEDK